MSSKKCSRCEKTVYPLEELKCLDKLWHKQCFKCQECGMTLNMKTYKGYDKQPYCNAHCPKAKHTVVADTLEIKRLADNTKLQSNVKYHEDFEKQKGKLTQVADDPETLRIRSTTKIISNVSYHGELERKKQMEEKRHLVPEKNGVNGGDLKSPEVVDYNPPAIATAPQPRQTTTTINTNTTSYTPSGKIADYAPVTAPETKDSPYSAKLTSTVIYTSQEGPVQNPPLCKIGSIADYDPLNDKYGSLATGYRPVDHLGNPYPVREPVPVATNPTAVGRSFRAMYDYAAQDSDEVSFLDGDIIVNCNAIDEGWMTGTVRRTGQTGMLPANYVEQMN